MKKYQILFLLCLLPLFAQAYEADLIDNIYYNLWRDEAEVTNRVGGMGGDQDENMYNNYFGDVNIPESFKYRGTTYRVTSIGEYAFAEDHTRLFMGMSLTSVTIPNSVTSIGSLAFNGCQDLPSVTIPNSVTSIGEFAFGGCAGLTSVTLGTGVTSINHGVFAGCKSLTSFTIPNIVTSIGMYAFNYCSGLTSVSIGNSVTTIGKSAFY